MKPKFRAWNGERIVKVLTIGWTDGEIDWIDTSKISGSVEDFIVMQSTGLEDKSGVEIYEGDIIDYFRKYKSIIEWRNGGFIIRREADGAYELIQDRLGEIEVIGNIYENPELLKEQNK